MTFNWNFFISQSKVISLIIILSQILSFIDSVDASSYKSRSHYVNLRKRASSGPILYQNHFIDTTPAVLGAFFGTGFLVATIIFIILKMANGGYSRTVRVNKDLSRNTTAVPSTVELPRGLMKPAPRRESTPDNREQHSAVAVAAAKEFIEGNNNKREFPVLRPYEKNDKDEINLVPGDKIVLTRIFADGWGEGVSKHSGGPYIFPISCLGGSVPYILTQRYYDAYMRKHGKPPVMQTVSGYV